MAAQPRQGEPAQSVQGDDSLAPARVLLIEDEPGIVDFLRRGLTAEGFAVERASTASRASGWRSAGGFDAIVLDLMLPGRAGWRSSRRSGAPRRPCR